MYPYLGLPGGSNGEGPASWVGLLVVWLLTVAVVGGLLAMLFYAVQLIGKS